MITLIVVTGVLFYIFGGLVVFRICHSYWSQDCDWSDHFDCGHAFAAIMMGIFWPIAPPLYLLSIALWRLAVVVSDKFKPKEDK